MKRTRPLAKRLDLVITQLPVPSFVRLARGHFLFPSTIHIVDRMLELAKIKKTDMLYDMGTCDGRIVPNSQA
jgi:hypothetical protein